MRRVLVTGGNKGIGRAIVAAILERDEDTFVFLGSRDEARGHAARDELVAAHGNWADRLRVVGLDVSDDASVQAATKAVAEAAPGESAPLYGIVNNAGVHGGAGDLAKVLDVNLHGIRRVCEGFGPLLQPQGGRIVNVTSAAGPMFVSSCSDARKRELTDPAITRAQLDALTQECLGHQGAQAFGAAGLGDGETYGLSKALANAYTLLLAREEPALVVNACTPGFIETDMTRPWAQSRGTSPESMGMKPPSAGAHAPLFLLFDAPEGTGHYYGSDAVRSPLDRYRAPGDPPYTGVG